MEIIAPKTRVARSPSEESRVVIIAGHGWVAPRERRRIAALSGVRSASGSLVPSCTLNDVRGPAFSFVSTTDFSAAVILASRSGGSGSRCSACSSSLTALGYSPERA